MLTNKWKLSGLFPRWIRQVPLPSKLKIKEYRANNFVGSWPAYACLWSSRVGFGHRQLLRTRCISEAWRWNAIRWSRPTSYQLHLSGSSLRWIVSKWRVIYPGLWNIWKRTLSGSPLLAKHWKYASGCLVVLRYSLVARNGLLYIGAGTLYALISLRVYCKFFG